MLRKKNMQINLKRFFYDNSSFVLIENVNNRAKNTIERCARLNKNNSHFLQYLFLV